MFGSINKTFGCCGNIFGCSNKILFVVPNFVAVTKPFFPWLPARGLFIRRVLKREVLLKGYVTFGSFSHFVSESPFDDPLPPTSLDTCSIVGLFQALSQRATVPSPARASHYNIPDEARARGLVYMGGDGGVSKCWLPCRAAPRRASVVGVGVSAAGNETDGYGLQSYLHDSNPPVLYCITRERHVCSIFEIVHSYILFDNEIAVFC